MVFVVSNFRNSLLRGSNNSKNITNANSEALTSNANNDDDDDNDDIPDTLYPILYCVFTEFIPMIHEMIPIVKALQSNPKYSPIVNSESTEKQTIATSEGGSGDSIGLNKGIQHHHHHLH